MSFWDEEIRTIYRERDREEIFKFIRYKITTVMVPYATNEKAASYAAMVDNLVADMQHRQATKAK